MYQFTEHTQPLYHQNGYQDGSEVYCELKNQTPVPVNQFQTFTTHPVVSSFSKQCDPQAQTVQAKKSTKIVKSSNVDTSNFTIEERLVTAVWVHERKRTKTSISQIRNEFRQRFGRDPPAKNTLLVWEKKLFSSGSVHDAPRPGRPIHRNSHIEEVAASMHSAPALSLRARASALRVPHTTLRTILQRDLPNLAKHKDTGGSKLQKKQTKKVKRIPKNKSKSSEQTCGGNPPMSGHPLNNTHPTHYLHQHYYNQNGYLT